MARKVVFGGTWALGIVFAVLLFTLTPAPGRTASGDAQRWERFGSSDVGSQAMRAMGTANEYFITAGAHLGGSAGTNWRTDVEIHNCGATQASYTIHLLKRDQDNGAAQMRSYSIGPGQSVRYNDILMQLFSFSGGAALRVTVSSGCVMVNSRTYNLLVDGTYGQFVRGQPLAEALSTGQNGRLFHLTHNRSTSGGFRTNLGLVNGGQGGVEVVLDFFTSSGASLGTVKRNLGSYGYTQLDRAFEMVTGGDVADGYVVVTVTTPGGRVFAYASVIDNLKGDAVFIPLEVNVAGVPPTATASPTATVSPTASPTATVPPPPSYGPLTFSSGFNESTGQPIDPGTSFAYGITKLYGSWPFANVTPGTAFTFSWYRDGSYSTGGSSTLGVASGKAWQWIQQSGGGPLVSGTYELRITVGGQVVLSGQATVGPAPTPTTQPASVNLAKVFPNGWQHCAVCNWREINPPWMELLSIYYETHFYWSTANLGPGTLYGPVRFGIYLDDVQIKSIRYDNPGGWPAGSGLAFHVVLDQIDTPGQHTVIVSADWDNAIPETNETDNSCGFVSTWEAILVSAQDEAAPSAPDATVWTGPIIDLSGSDEPVRPALPHPGQSSASSTDRAVS